MRNTLTSLTVLLFGCVLAAQGQTPAFTSSGVLNAASQAAGPLAPGMLAFINGSNLGGSRFTDCAVTTPVPTSCNGISVLVNGQLAPVLNAVASELEFQVPFNVSAGSATLQVTFTSNGTTFQSAIVSLPVAAAAPGLISNGTAGYYYDLSQSSLFSAPAKTVLAGDTVEIFGTGLGVTSPVVAAGIRGPDPVAASVAGVTLTVGTLAATVQVAGLQPADAPSAVLLSPGTDEILFTVPAGLAPGTYPMVVSVGGVQSQTPGPTLTVVAPPVDIVSISPATPPMGANQVVTVTGAGFTSPLTVTMYLPGGGSTTISGSQIQSVTATSFQMTATFTKLGTYSIQITIPSGTQSNTFAFDVGPALPMVITTVENDASYAAGIESGSWVSIIGTSLAPDTRLWQASDFVGLGTGLPMSLDGVSVTIDGKSAAVYYISPTQLNVQAPTDSAIGTVSVVVKNGSTTASGTATLQTYAPAFFPLYAPGNPAGSPVYAAAVHLDGVIVVPPAFYGAGVTTRSATPGETIEIYGTGFGPTNPAVPAGQLVSGAPPLTNPSQLQITIGGVPATVSYAGMVAVGEYQFNVVIPALPNGNQPIVANIGGVTSQTGILIPIQN